MTRFPNRAHFASWNGTAPIDASSGEQVRHRLSVPGTGRSTGCCTSWPPSSCAIPPKDAPTSTARRPPARHRWKRCAP
ncbi:IS110 family transposase [Micromonospora sp. NBC_01655]|uniref:transposase n=1 Tax=Micromonospora sp. NBC_01655 TaxID=2975983 RepID=UPI0022529CC2|nr:transposase [Micromonospora sp. NBC_01655]MCX4471416.1 IS110 family transposase [Micromonospora sp. NBC_01655]